MVSKARELANLGEAYTGGDLTLSGGVYVGGTGSANYLDDYEEGTWTPTGFTNWSVNPTITTAKYTKVGRLVTLEFIFLGGTTGTAGYFVGVPFSGEGAGPLVNGSIQDKGHTLVNGTIMWFTANSTNLTGSRVSVTYMTST